MRISVFQTPACNRAHPTGRDLASYLLTAIFLTAVHASQASGLAQCMGKRITFDGIVPLQYATVTGQSKRLYINRKFPGKCDSDKTIACRGRVYVLAGDAVAIGKECGNWAYVQYIGRKRVITGWALSSRLEVTPSPQKAVPRVRQMGGYKFIATPRRYIFKVVRGAGRPVCEAYLQRLNQTYFYAPPYCGRPESAVVPGFARLTRIPLTRAETAALYPRLYSFNLVRRSGRPQPLDPTDTKIAESGGSGPSIFAWRYNPEVDIGNNDELRNVVIWAGRPLSSYYASCGSQQLLAGRQVTARWAQIAIIASKDTAGIDDNLTLRIFGSPTDGLPVENRQHTPPWMGFIPIGDSFSIFKYKTLTYYDTFYAGGGWPDFYGDRANVPSLDKHLAVFLRYQNETREICEYTYRSEN